MGQIVNKQEPDWLMKGQKSSQKNETKKGIEKALEWQIPNIIRNPIVFIRLINRKTIFKERRWADQRPKRKM